MVRQRLADGEGISQGLAKTKHFPVLVVNMFATGEESGRLGETTQRIADAYEQAAGWTRPAPPDA